MEALKVRFITKLLTKVSHAPPCIHSHALFILSSCAFPDMIDDHVSHPYDLGLSSESVWGLYDSDLGIKLFVVKIPV